MALVEQLKRDAWRFVQAFNTETRLATRSWTIHWLGWIWPLLLFVVISGIYKAGTLQDMPVSVVDEDTAACRGSCCASSMPVPTRNW